MFNIRYKSHHDAENEYKHLLKPERSSKQELFDYLNTNTCTQKDNAIYIHIPFCDRICTFCNMNRKIKENSLQEYVENLLLQIKEFSQTKYIQSANISAIYFGGGTPTTLKPEQMDLILSNIFDNFCIDKDAEITSETTLHNLTKEHLKVFEKRGLNRLSIGVQTFQDEGRKFFNRTYTKDEVIKNIKALKSEFNGCLSIDKIYNYSCETLEMLTDDVNNIIDLDIDSVSFYSLMIHDGSVLSKNMQLKHTNENDELFHNTFVNELTKKADFEFLELTKLARKNRDLYKYMCIRNANGNTIPLGKGAGGQIDGYGIYVMDFERIMVSKQQNEIATLANKLYGLFQNTTIEKSKLYDYDLSTSLDILIKNGYIKEDTEKFILTNSGIFYGNNIGGYIVKNYLEKELLS